MFQIRSFNNSLFPFRFSRTTVHETQNERNKLLKLRVSESLHTPHALNHSRTKMRKVIPADRVCRTCCSTSFTVIQNLLVTTYYSVKVFASSGPVKHSIDHVNEFRSSCAKCAAFVFCPAVRTVTIYLKHMNTTFRCAIGTAKCSEMRKVSQFINDST